MAGLDSMAMEVTAYWKGGYRTRIPVRQFEMRIDQPPRYGGDDTGPTPTEAFLGSLAACFAMALAHVAKKRGVTLAELAVRTRGEYAGPRFSRITVEVISSHPADELAPVLERAIGYCYITNTLRRPPQIEYRIAGSDVSHVRSPPPD